MFRTHIEELEDALRTAEANREAVAESRAKLEAALASMTDAVFISDAGGNFVHANEAFVTYHRFRNKEECSKRFADCSKVLEVFLPDGTSAPPEMWAVPRALRGERVSYTEYILRRKDTGETWTGSYSFAPIRNQDGAITGSVVVARDISAGKKAEEVLKRQADLLRLSYDAMIAWQLGGAIESWNIGAERLYGYSEAEALGKLTHSLLATSFPKPWEEIRTEMRRNSSWEGELRHRARDGREIIVSARLQLIVGSDGVERVLEVNRDITGRKQAEQRLLESQKLESLGLLAGGVAHDFNNLLVGVIGNASLAQEMLPPGHPVAELIATIVQTGERAAHLTRQMLAYSGRGAFLLEILDLSDAVREIADLVRPSIPKKIGLTLKLAEGLLPIEADRGQLQQIVMNLALNAAEAIGNRDGLIAITTGVRTVDSAFLRSHPEAADLLPGEHVLLEVRDTGCGMDEAVKARIFDPFFSTKFTGRGLGLAAVSGIVRGHKGAIFVTSAPGKGSTFEVLLPVAQCRREPVPVGSPGFSAANPGVVLIVDDEQLVRDLARAALERSGYTVLVADGGGAAIDILKRHPGAIDLVVLDLSMPGPGAEETLPAVNRIRPNAKVCVSSGYGETEVMALFRGERISGFLQKPYTTAALLEKVKLVLA